MLTQALAMYDSLAQRIGECDAKTIFNNDLDNTSGLGIGTLASWLSRNKTLALTPLHAKEAVAPTQENVISGRYPLSRTYYLYVNRAPGKDLAPAVAEFLQFALSREGQAAVAQAMLYPLPMEIAQMNRKRLRAN